MTSSPPAEVKRATFPVFKLTNIRTSQDAEPAIAARYADSTEN